MEDATPAERRILTDPASNLRAFMKTRTALDGSDTVFLFQGKLAAAVPGERKRVLFGLLGINVAL